MKIRYVISLTVLLSAIFCLFLYNFLATNGLPLRERVIQYNPANSSKNKVYVLLEKHKEKQWDEHSNMCGFELDCYIHNENSCLSVTDWEVTFLVPKRTYIDSNPWSAVFELHEVNENGVLTARQFNKNEIQPRINKITDFNAKPQSTFFFGCIMHAPRNWPPEGTITTIKYTPVLQINLMRYSIIIPIFLVMIITSSLTYIVVTYIRDIQQKQSDLQNREFISSALKVFANTIEAKDHYTKGHSERVAVYSREIAKKLGLSRQEQENIYYCAILHDVGKIGIPDSVLNKNGRLTEEEYGIMKTHTLVGGEIFRSFKYIPGIDSAVRHHHEWFDGSGYPDKLVGEAIPLYARIICVADSFDAMTTNRVYRQAFPIEVVRSELEKRSGSQFDPRIASIMIKMIDELPIGQP